MFIKINNINYYIQNAEQKSVKQIFHEIFSRMSKSFVSEQEKRNIYSQITNQIKN